MGVSSVTSIFSVASLNSSCADRAVEHLLLVLRVADHVAGGEDRELRHQLGDVEGRDRRQFQVAACHRGRLGALLEQRGVQVDLHVEFARCALVERFLEHRPHLAVPVIRHGRGRDAQQHLVLRHCGRGTARRRVRQWRQSGYGAVGKSSSLSPCDGVGFSQSRVQAERGQLIENVLEVAGVDAPPAAGARAASRRRPSARAMMALSAGISA